MSLNDPQQIAINTIDKNVAVNAGAGTGKTKVLTERFVHILENGNLEDGKEIESIVAITFTKKATQEMTDRIRKEIRKNFSKGSKWRMYYRDMDKSNISTIHSFCAKILRENPIEAKLDPLFEVLEDSVSTKLLKESIREVLNNGIEKDEEVYKLLRLFKKNSTDFIVNDFYDVYNKIRTVGISFEELKEKSLDYIKKLKIEESDLIIIKETFHYLIDKLPKNSKIYKLREDVNWIRFIEGDYDENELPKILAYLYDNIGTSTKEPEKIDLLKKTMAKTLLGSEVNNINYYNTVLDLLIDININYDLKKREIGGLDYDDLQIMVLKLLDNEFIRNMYQDKFKYIMIDEFQDTNELQKNIFYKLATVNKKLDKSNLFVVGDPKQSIYGFRGADLDVFYDVIEDIKLISNEDTITLQKNYRTVGTVISFINNIFGQLMPNKYSPLKEFHISENQIDVEILENINLQVPIGQNQNNYYRHFEAELIAKRIKELVISKKFKYGDFAILFRATTRNHIYEDALKNFGIPYYNSGGKRFFLQQEILDLINALKSISNPYDTIATIGFLRSPLIGLSDRIIYWILKSKDSTVYNSLVEVENNSYLSDEEKRSIIDARSLIDELYLMKNLYDLSKLVDTLISKTYFIQSLLLKQGGKQSVANVYKFRDIVKEYEKRNIATMEDFIDYLEESKERDESQGKTESENADVVKILTIHKSKGLQFPVVIVPEMSTSGRGNYPNILFDKNIGIGVQFGSTRALYDSIRKEADRKDKEERERILYVAMTRAEKMLILGNQGKDSGFKKMIKDLINPDQCKIISDIDMDMEGYSSVNLINKELVNHRESTNVQLPLLYQISDHNKKTLERFSISQYLSFIDCNRKFYMDYYRKIVTYEEPNEKSNNDSYLTGLEKGNIIHKFIEHYKLGMDQKILLEKVCKSFGTNYNDSIYEKLTPYINNYLKEYNEDYDQIYIEKPFYLKIKDSFITGVIDRVNIKNGKAEIIDFKTNRVTNKNELINHYLPQLQLYAYVVKEVMEIELDSVGILFLEDGEFVKISINERSLEENISRIESFIDFVSNNSNILNYMKNDRNCNFCEHKSICSLT
ncbi:UvrD-helicase domain-containing protein [Tissierella sp.]|uniref:UvrD-helicase domain-containing protein n=1 Tax=Tissierella sp. TaxID=41274 RepID=UPI00285F5649|nr:UvrD-helicase domain-containing protein [Tissierella sp.]MDR7857270.1 UvrD-helicase domain-containing protein [Tissierella sp.]